MGIIIIGFVLLVLFVLGGIAFLISKRIKKELDAQENKYAWLISGVAFLIIFAALVLGVFYLFITNVKFER
ncbi:hypothetical protein ACFOWM_09425 [Ferruginibacter yonginensis]|uniref:Cardiolipin synthase N-terminal domain-containing protein n=1 Tax=Ferruginibacter yonginensis TaxID=1310416 RepID=A0ABV8QUN0_9BACT